MVGAAYVVQRHVSMQSSSDIRAIQSKAIVNDTSPTGTALIDAVTDWLMD